MSIFAYLDASGDESLPSMSAAGFIASEDQWKSFEKDWKAALLKENVCEFHMKDFAHSTGEFVEWKGDEPRRIKFLKSLKAIMLGNTTASVGVCLFVEDYRRANSHFCVREFLGGPYSVTMMWAILISSFWRDRERPNDDLMFSIERGDSGQGELFDTLSRINFELPVDALSKRITKPNGTIEYITRFQACDFIAWEAQKATRTSHEKGVDEITGRKSFLGVIPKSNPRLWRYIDYRSLRKLCEKLGIPSRNLSIHQLDDEEL